MAHLTIGLELPVESRRDQGSRLDLCAEMEAGLVFSFQLGLLSLLESINFTEVDCLEFSNCFWSTDFLSVVVLRLSSPLLSFKDAFVAESSKTTGSRWLS